MRSKKRARRSQPVRSLLVIAALLLAACAERAPSTNASEGIVAPQESGRCEDPESLDAWKEHRSRRARSDIEIEEELITAVRIYGRRNADTYAGLVIGYEEPALLPSGSFGIAMFTGDLPRHRATLPCLVSRPDRLRFASAEYPLRDLEAVSREIWGDRIDLLHHGVEMTGLSVDEKGNRVALEVANLSFFVTAELNRRYPMNMVTVEEVPPFEVDVDPEPSHM